MALLIFPSNPLNGQLFPVSPVAGQNQYQWDSADVTWRLLGAATGVTPGDYCSTVGSVPRFTVDAQGRITTSQCVDLNSHFVKTNNISAYNSYVWPNTDGSAGQVLATNGVGDLTWITTGGGGGGGGSVTFVGVSNGIGVVGGGASITTTGTLEFKNGLGLSVNGSFVKVSIPTVSPAPSTGIGQLQAMPGSLYWDSTLGELFIYYDDGTTAQWISTTGGSSPPPAGYGLVVESTAFKIAIPAFPNPPTVSVAAADATTGSMYYDTALGALFYYYFDGVSSQWVQV